MDLYSSSGEDRKTHILLYLLAGAVPDMSSARGSQLLGFFPHFTELRSF
jgi:hypothetical protein